MTELPPTPDSLRLKPPLESFLKEESSPGTLRQPNSPSLIYLIGFMGAGKSTLAPLLAQALQGRWLDTDTVLTEHLGMPLGVFFRRKGEAAFRALETQLIQTPELLGPKIARLLQPPETLPQKSLTVIACGGGLPIIPGLMPFLKLKGWVVWLRAPWAELVARVGPQDPARPLWNPLHLQQLLKTREPIYRLADFSIDTAEYSLPETVSRLTSAYLDYLRSRPAQTPPPLPCEVAEPEAD